MVGLGRIGAVVLLSFSLLLLSACGDDEAPSAGDTEVPSWAKVAPEQIAEAKKHGVPVAFENDLGMRFVLIPAGTFLMGSHEDEEGRDDDDETQHEVTITNPYYMQITEVTNAQYRRWKSGHVARFFDGTDLDDERQPVVLVSWRDATDFAEWLSRGEGRRTYRLPMETEWERAVRGGVQGLTYPWGNEDDSWWRNGNGDGGYEYSAPVGQFPPSRYGLHDMAGNVREWCREMAREDLAQDEPFLSFPCGPDGPRRMVRGGSWRTPGNQHRCASRTRLREGLVGVMVGFRLVSALPEPKSSK